MDGKLSLIQARMRQFEKREAIMRFQNKMLHQDQRAETFQSQELNNALEMVVQGGKNKRQQVRVFGNSCSRQTGQEGQPQQCLKGGQNSVMEKPGIGDLAGNGGVSISNIISRVVGLGAHISGQNFNFGSRKDRKTKKSS